MLSSCMGLPVVLASKKCHDPANLLRLCQIYAAKLVIALISKTSYTIALGFLPVAEDWRLLAGAM